MKIVLAIAFIFFSYNLFAQQTATVKIKDGPKYDVEVVSKDGEYLYFKNPSTGKDGKIKLELIEDISYHQSQEIPFNDEGKVEFIEIISFDSIGKEELFINSQEWVVNAYNSANDVIQMNDKEAGKLIVKGIHQYNNALIGDLNLHHTLSVSVKDGKIRVSLSNLVFKFILAKADIEVPFEDTANNLYKKDGTPYKQNHKHKDEVFAFWESIKAGITKKVSEAGDNW